MTNAKDFGKLSYRLRKSLYIFGTIIRSFKYAGYYVFWLKFLQVIFVPIDLLCAFIERIFYPCRPAKDTPVIFVVGIHRTGSTLVSQYIADTFPCFPIGNFAAIAKRSNYLLHRFFSFFYRKRKKLRFRNFYGISTGFYTIGDAYEFWDQWFGKNHYLAPASINNETKDRIRCHFHNLYHAYKKPLVTKNNRNSLMIDQLYKIFPNAFFVIVEREPVSVIRSTVKASRDFFGNSNILWGIMPYKTFSPDNYTNIIEAATKQYVELEKVLKNSMRNIPAESYIKIDYDSFCKYPQYFQKQLQDILEKKYNLDIYEVKNGDRTFHVSKRLNNNALEQKIAGYLKKWTVEKRNYESEDTSMD